CMQALELPPLTF
nr:immunoglobulin light chain junction region [Macaca mulatta]MOY01641.1 immunoglobulin light chain junction region [Macaca mulatta]MOY02766.1 immunoglobulin light chain junction region [Macaca mulatta]